MTSLESNLEFWGIWIMKRLITFVLILLPLLILDSSISWAVTTQVTLSWDSLKNPNVTGYQVVWGPISNVHANALKVGNVSQANLEVNSGTVYSFAVCAIDTQGNPGELSSNVSAFISSNRSQIGARAVAPADGLYLPGVKDNEQFRTNLGVNNPAQEAAHVAITMVDRDGIVQSIKTIEVPPGGMIQTNRILNDLSNNNYGVSVEGNLILESDQKILAWASEIDNHTNDPSMLISKKAGTSRILIPSAANTGAWTSSLALENLGSADSPVSITVYSPKGEIVAQNQGMLLVPAMGSLSFSNILDVLGAGNSYGPLEIISTNGQPLIATSRVSGTTGAGGFFEGVSSESASRSQVIPQIIEDNSIRTNLGINNWSNQIANVVLYFRDQFGAVLARMTIQVAPNGLKQINASELAQAINQGSGASIECSVVIDSDQPVIGWASQIENGLDDPGFTLGKNIGGKRLLIPSSANNGTWSSSLIIVNPSSQFAYVDIVVRDNQGSTLGQMMAIIIPARGFFSRNNILSFLNISNNYGPIEITTRTPDTTLLATSRVRSTDRTGGFFECRILE